MKRRLTILIILITAVLDVRAQNQYDIYGSVHDSVEQSKVLDGLVMVRNTMITSEIENNQYRLTRLKPGRYQVIIEPWGYDVVVFTVEIVDRDVEYNLLLNVKVEELKAVKVTSKSTFDSDRLPDVKGVSIFASKKTEVVIPSPMTSNLANNLPRQLFKSVPGLNIWESDAGGLQLGIGARGLNPNRTSNFNTRQNGYDISADALGYPESYYTPPSEAIKQIEVVRGAASLQYGPQFGGMLNFVLDDGPDNVPYRLKGSVSGGSYDYFQVFDHLTINRKAWKFSSAFQYKKGGGFRPNSGFEQKTFIAMLSRKLNERIVLSADYTYMRYLAQQPGGLMDFQFEQDPTQSFRSRNWFEVRWNLASASMDYKVSRRLRFNSKLWVLHAERNSVGELGKINRPDPMGNRDLIRGSYQNLGWENRFLLRYKVKKVRSTMSWGTRTYLGFTENQQGIASNGSFADFEYLDPDTPGVSSYRFPGVNHAFFAENLLHLGNKWTVTPGVRIEYIRTAAKGYYINKVWSGDQVIFEKVYDFHKVRRRAFPLFGIGSSYRIKQNIEIYGNASENYRSISFGDLTISNPNLVIDSSLTDESGCNLDFGVRGVIGKEKLRFDIGLFYLKYNNRIGIAEKELMSNGVSSLVSYRTNIGEALTKGLEGYIEWNITAQSKRLDSICKNVSVFLNGSIMDGHYVDGQNEYIGNILEFVPEFNIKTGVIICYRNAFISYQVAYTSEQYTDATNATFVSDATRGLIPAYWVQDLNIGYEFKSITLKASINNLADSKYFTRRALSYPGPGIIPSEPRSIYATLIYNIQQKSR